MSLSWENICARCGSKFDTLTPQTICNICWTNEDTIQRRKFEYSVEKTDKENLLRFKLKIVEKKLKKLPRWLVKML